ncbi:cobalamin biosynthesis protein [Sphingobium bisphenolivorans]|uniref:cobalamin biosynthesis protein n=1 Tax=Sphingobium bisphenolivorans TaxID=1335760 RepID=UPI0003A09471|nr:cobalamin biosynthesis protein [Sphingobium bisphenolivorans]
MIVAGFGCRAGATPASLHAALSAATQGQPMPDALATLRAKAPQLAPLAQSLALALILLDGQALEQQTTLTHSPASLAAHDTGSVAEAAALAAAGPGARLLAPRHISPDRLATCALAEGRPA